MSDTAAAERPDEGTLREYVDSLLVTVVLALFVTTFLLQAFTIPSSSMEKTLLVGDYLLVNKFAFAGEKGAGFGLLPYREVRRGDIIVFKYPFGNYPHFVKRVIGLPGDRLKIANRQVFINEQPLAETYKMHTKLSAPGSFQDNFPPSDLAFAFGMEAPWKDQVERLRRGGELVVPPGKYFVMGDNRDNSQDSRYWGFVDRENIIGRPLLIYWSFDASRRADGVAEPQSPLAAVWDNFLHFFSRARWNRLLRLVR
jgi:signal peptidase I